jgi:hypothetical protein
MTFALDGAEKALCRASFLCTLYPDGPPSLPPGRLFNGYKVEAYANAFGEGRPGFGVKVMLRHEPTEDRPDLAKLRTAGGFIRWGPGPSVVDWNVG